MRTLCRSVFAFVSCLALAGCGHPALDFNEGVVACFQKLKELDDQTLRDLLEARGDAKRLERVCLQHSTRAATIVKEVRSLRVPAGKEAAEFKAAVEDILTEIERSLNTDLRELAAAFESTNPDAQALQTLAERNRQAMEPLQARMQSAQKAFATAHNLKLH